MILKFLLFCIVFYVTNDLYFERFLPLQQLGFKGLNAINLLFIAALLAHWMQGASAATPAPLRGRFLFFFVVMTLAFLVGQLYDSSTFVDDLTVLKNAIFYMLLYFLFYYSVHDTQTIRRLLIWVLVVAAGASLMMVREAFDYGLGSYRESHRVAGPMGPYNYRMANSAAAYVVMYLPIFAVVALYYRSGLLRLMALGGVVVGIMAVFFTGSRQAYFIVVVLAGMLALRRGVFAVLVVGIALVSYESWVPESVVERLQMTKQEDTLGNEQYDESTESRFVQWAGAVELFQGRPWGIGLNHFKREIGSVTIYPNLDAHNVYFLILAEAGILGIVALLWLMWGLWKLGRKLRGMDVSYHGKLLGLGYSLAVIGMMLGNVYGSRFLDGRVMGGFWILTGLVARYYTLAREAEAKRAELSQASELAVTARV